jgi:anthranilate phosphoribosyltransferase
MVTAAMGGRLAARPQAQRPNMPRAIVHGAARLRPALRALRSGNGAAAPVDIRDVSAAALPRLRAAAAAAATAAAHRRPPPFLPPPQVIEQLLERRDLTEAQAEGALSALLGGADPAQIAGFLIALRAKGETAGEVAGLARAMRARAAPVAAGGDVLDIVGTGGDGIGSVNISTGATVVAAAAGARVAKHGSRSVSSLCGAADVLEALGVPIGLEAAGVERCLREAGVGFMFAPVYHPAMAAVGPVRRALRVRTAFNLLGPMLNPAGATHALVGVYSPAVAPLMAGALQRLGVKRALVVHSMGLDELTPMGPADVLEVAAGGGAPRAYVLEPRDLGIPRCEVADLAGGDAALNAAILRDAFGGARGAVADALCLNAGAALAAAGLADDAREGVAMAQEAQRSGRAGVTLEKWVAVGAAAMAAQAAAAA